MMADMTFAKTVAIIGVIATLGGGGYKGLDLVWNDGKFKGKVLTELQAIPEMKRDIKEIQKDIKELLQRIPPQ